MTQYQYLVRRHQTSFKLHLTLEQTRIYKERSRFHSLSTRSANKTSRTKNYRDNLLSNFVNKHLTKQIHDYTDTQRFMDRAAQHLTKQIHDYTDTQQFMDRAAQHLTKQIHDYIETKQWEQIIPFIDKLISQIDTNTVSTNFLFQFLDSFTQNHDIASRELVIHEIIEMIAILLKNIMVSVMDDNVSDARNHAKRIKEIILTAQEISIIASQEGLPPLHPSQIIQIDTIEGKPIYALK